MSPRQGSYCRVPDAGGGIGWSESCRNPPVRQVPLYWSDGRIYRTTTVAPKTTWLDRSCHQVVSGRAGSMHPHDRVRSREAHGRVNGTVAGAEMSDRKEQRTAL